MWTPGDRERVGDYGCGRSLSDEQWRIIEPFIPPEKPGGRHRDVDMRACLTDRRRIRSTARRSGAASLYPTYGLFEIRTFQDLHRMPNNSISSQTGSECGRSSISSRSPASASPGAQVDGAQERTWSETPAEFHLQPISVFRPCGGLAR